MAGIVLFFSAFWFFAHPVVAFQPDPSTLAVQIADSYYAKRLSLKAHQIHTAVPVGDSVQTEYSVLPGTWSNVAWYGGNGEIQENGWLVHASGTISYLRLFGCIYIAYGANTGCKQKAGVLK